MQIRTSPIANPPHFLLKSTRTVETWYFSLLRSQKLGQSEAALCSCRNIPRLISFLRLENKMHFSRHAHAHTRAPQILFSLLFDCLIIGRSTMLSPSVPRLFSLASQLVNHRIFPTDHATGMLTFLSFFQKTWLVFVSIFLPLQLTSRILISSHLIPISLHLSFWAQFIWGIETRRVTSEQNKSRKLYRKEQTIKNQRSALFSETENVRSCATIHRCYFSDHQIFTVWRHKNRFSWRQKQSVTAGVGAGGSPWAFVRLLSSAGYWWAQKRKLDETAQRRRWGGRKMEMFL